MFGSEIIEIATGLVFVYLIASLVATTVREAVEGILKTRAIHLERGIRQLLDDPTGAGVTQQVFDHPLLYSLFAGKYDPDALTKFLMQWRRGGSDQNGAAAPAKRVAFFNTLPAYIPSGNFALALMHCVAGKNDVLTIGSFTQAATMLPDGRLKQAMLVAIGEAKGDLDRARTSIEALFDSTMDRVSGWYKRETSWILFGMGLVIAVGLNVDTLGIARDLATNNTERQKLIAQVDSSFQSLQQQNGALDEASLSRQVEVGLKGVIGWDQLIAARRLALGNEILQGQPWPMKPADKAALDTKIDASLQQQPWYYWPKLALFMLPGWIISALAISLGAPFWFDMLNKLMVIRSTVKPFEKSAPEASADRGGAVMTDPLPPAPPAPAIIAPAIAALASVPAGGLGTPTPPAAAPMTATMRFAFDGANPGSVQVGFVTAVPEDGFLEVPVPIGAPHTITATGTRDGHAVSWSQTVTAGIDDEQKPVAATLS